MQLVCDKSGAGFGLKDVEPLPDAILPHYSELLHLFAQSLTVVCSSSRY